MVASTSSMPKRQLAADELPLKLTPVTVMRVPPSNGPPRGWSEAMCTGGGMDDVCKACMQAALRGL